MHAVLVLNGDRPGAELLRRLAGRGTVYAADGGAQACVDAGVEPEWVLGDFDSVDPASLPAHWLCLREENQELTDFEKLVARLPAEVSEVTLLGGLGGRLDHLLSNLICAAGLPDSWQVRFLGGGGPLLRVTPECSLCLEVPAGIRISLLAPGAAEGVTASGLQWPLQDACLGPGQGLGQSNLSTGTVSVSVRTGGLWVWVEKEYPL